MNRAIVVTGVARSGCFLFASCLPGFVGPENGVHVVDNRKIAWHVRPTKRSPGRIVVARPVPWRSYWPSIGKVCSTLIRAGYETSVVWMIRDTHSTVSSMFAHRIADGGQDGWKIHDKAFQLIKSDLDSFGIDRVLVCYDWLNNACYRKWLEKKLKTRIEIKWQDANLKYLNRT